jgi:hypothetical protein
MPDYRAYIIGIDGHFVDFEPLVCTDDAEATEKAKRLVDGHDVELWEGARLVVVLQYTSNEVRAFERQIYQSQHMSKGAKDEAASARMDKLTSDLRQEKDEQQKRDDEK